MDERDYKNIISAWLSSYPAATLEALVGPCVSTERAVTVASITRLAPLLTLFVTRGQEHCVLLGSRVESAISNLFLERPHLVQKNMVAETLMFAQHIMVVAKVVRSFAREEHNPGAYRRYPKTSALRRRMTAADWVVLTPLLQLVKVCKTSEEADMVGGYCSSADSARTHVAGGDCSSARTRSHSPASTLAYSDNGFPKFEGIKDAEGELSVAPQTPTVRSVQLDADGWPIFGAAKSPGTSLSACAPTAASASSSSFPGLSSLVAGSAPTSSRESRTSALQTGAPMLEIGAVVGVCTPNPKARKRLALEAREAKKHKNITASGGQSGVAAAERSPPTTATKSAAQRPAAADDLPLQRITSTCTAEKNPRFQITAYVSIAGQPKRVHVVTLTKSAWGDMFSEVGAAITKYCKETPGVTMAMALKFKDRLAE